MTATIVPYSQAWRERMTDKRAGTSLCGWCLGPPGARRPHRFGIVVANCPCGCHRKPRVGESKRPIETNAKILEFMKGGGYGTGEAV